jgi:hypothetical protein
VKPGELVIYVDESGSPDVISTNGEDLLALGRTCNYFVLVALRSFDPSALARLMVDCTAWGDQHPDRKRPRGALDHLHASKDDDVVRKRVYEALAGAPIKATAIVVDKRSLDPAKSWRGDRTALYNELMARLLSDSLHLYERTRIVISRKNLDTPADLDRMVRQIESGWNEYVDAVHPTLPSLITARHGRARASRGLQAVDYIAWALFRGFESGDARYYNMIKDVVRHIHDISSTSLHHYTPKDPPPWAR